MLKTGAAALLAGAAAVAPAATVVWNNPGTGDWFAAGNWSGVVPGTNDLAFVSNGGTATHTGGSVAQARGLRVGADSPLPGVPTARGTVQLGTAGLQVGDQLIVGRSNDFLVPDGVVSQADGRVVVAGGLRLDPGSFSSSLLQVGVAAGGTAQGHLQVGFIDTSLGPVGNLSVGDAVRGGAAGVLLSGGGVLQVVGTAAVGRADSDQGASAIGNVVLDHRLQAGPAATQLLVGTLTGGSLTGLGTGQAEGSLSAMSLDSFESIAVGRTAVNQALGAVASGQLTVVSGGIVNNGGTGSFAVGEAIGLVNNGTVVGAAAATGSATVGGNLSGYNVVNVGSVSVSGVADGSLALNNGTLQTQGLVLGRVGGSAGAVVTDGQARAKGQLRLTDASANVATSFIGSVTNPNAGLQPTAEGSLLLTRSQFSGNLMQLGLGAGGTGRVELVDNSRLSLNGLAMGNGEAATGELSLINSRLDLVQVAGTGGTMTGGDLLVGSNGGIARVLAQGATLNVANNLSVNNISTALGDGSVRLRESSLTVGGDVGIGGFTPGSRAELSLEDSVATVDGSLSVGSSANGGQLFGQALLGLDASLLTVRGAFDSDLGATLLFGLDGLNRGLGGYGALDADSVLLRGLLSIDFSDLDLGLITGASQDFDLITAGSTILGGFSAVNLLGSVNGFNVSYGLAGANDQIWRLTLTRDDGGVVPEPSSLALTLAALLGAGWGRRQVLRRSRNVG